MEKHEALEKINEIYEGFQSGNIIQFSANRMIAIGIAILLNSLIKAVKPIYWFVPKETFMNFTMNTGNMILFALGNLLFLALLFFTAIIIADKLGPRGKTAQNRNIRIAFSLYKPVIITIISLILGFNIINITPNQNYDLVIFIYPMLLILTGYILYIIGKFSDKKIFTLSMINIISGISLMIIMPIIKIIFNRLYMIGVFQISMTKIELILVGISVLLSGIFHKIYIRNNHE